jgi:nucleoside-diphosphate-sugar epimerase
MNNKANHIISVLGGNGYIGKKIVDSLLKSHSNVKVYAICRSGKMGANDYHFDNTRLTVIKGNCLKPDTFSNVIKESTGIIHSIGTLFTSNPEEYDDFNRKTCVEVAKIANENNHKTNFVYISAERGIPFPLSQIYGGYIKSKRQCEEELLNKYNKLNSVILRPGFVMDAKERTWSVPLYYGVNVVNMFEQKVMDKIIPHHLGEKMQLPAHGIPLNTLAHFAAAGALGNMEGHKVYPNSYLLDPQNFKTL